MFFGIDLPTYDQFADVRVLTDLACESEAAGWDGFFLYDQVATTGAIPLVDPWIVLATIALESTRLRLGTLVTPLPRRRPWKVARETVTLDHLSNGRLVLGVGLGNAPEEFEDLGEEPALRTRATMLDEALMVLTGLWSGAPFSYLGEHYRVHEAQFLPQPVQMPRIPIWVGGAWPSRAPFRRAARWDGVFPHYRGPDGSGSLMPPDVLRDLLAYIHSHRTGDASFDVVLRGSTPGDDPVQAAAIVRLYQEAGLTWWLEGVEGGRDLAAVRTRIRQGPPDIQRPTSVL